MRRVMKNAIITFLILFLGISTIFLAYLHFFTPDDRNLTGEWCAELDMTGQVAAMAYGWLRDIEAVSVSLEEVEAYMQDLTIQVNLTMEQTGRAEGTFRCSVLPESYDTCRQAAYEAFAEAFRSLVAERLRMAGYGDYAQGEAVEALVNETFGMSAAAYLMNCGPSLLPSLEELQAAYDGSGTYEAAEGILVRKFDTGGAAGTRQEQYIRKESGLILLGETGDAAADGSAEYYPMIYTLKQPDSLEGNG